MHFASRAYLAACGRGTASRTEADADGCRTRVARCDTHPRTAQSVRSIAQQSASTHAERVAIDHEMARWLLRGPQPVDRHRLVRSEAGQELVSAACCSPGRWAHVDAARNGRDGPPTGRNGRGEALPAAVACHRARRRDANSGDRCGLPHTMASRSLGNGLALGGAAARPNAGQATGRAREARSMGRQPTTACRGVDDVTRVATDAGKPERSDQCRLVVYAKARQGRTNPNRRMRPSPLDRRQA